MTALFFNALALYFSVRKRSWVEHEEPEPERVHDQISGRRSRGRPMTDGTPFGSTG